MSYFVVTEEHGPSWDGSRARREQDGWDAHAALVVHAGSDDDVRARLAEDLWMTMGILRVLAIEPWEVLLDGRGPRMAGA
jgi:hypothetical protein